MAPSLEGFGPAANPEAVPGARAGRPGRGHRRAMRAGPGRGMRAGLAALALAALLPGCGTLQRIGDAAAGAPAAQPGEQGFVRGFLGGVAAEEPRAAVVARNVLSAGGNAADAAVAAGFMMSVTLPSRAGLGGGGACLLFSPRRNEVEAIVFPAGARAGVPAGADRPAAVPLMARGLFALHARAGRRPFEELMVPAEQAARLGVEVGQALATDLAAVAGPLLADPWSAAVFAGPGGRPLAVGERLLQSDLGGTLGVLRTAGIGDLHQGGLARRMQEASVPAGGGLTAAELRAATPRILPPVQQPLGNDVLSFLPPPADGGLAAAASFAALLGGAGAEAAAARGLAVARASRTTGGEPAALLASAPGGEGLSGLPASAGLVVLDRDGMAVSCAFSMNNLFGTGRVAPGTGVLLAAAPGIGRVQPALLSAGLVHNPNLRAFRAAAAGSGQEAAPMAVAAPILAALRGGQPAAPEPGRSQAIACARYLPGAAEACSITTDPRGAGLALGGLE